MDPKKVKETTRLLANAILSFFCFDNSVIYRRIEPIKYKKQTIMKEKGSNNYPSLEYLIFKASLSIKIFQIKKKKI